MTVKSKGKTLAEFRAAHDKTIIVPTKIRAALAQMEAEGGSENWDYEGDFTKRANISQSDMGKFREQFLAHVVEVPGTANRMPRRIWVASAKAAVKFRGE